MIQKYICFLFQLYIFLNIFTLTYQYQSKFLVGQIAPGESDLPSYPSEEVEKYISDNVDIKDLLPTYQLFLREEVLKKEIGDVDFTKLNIQPFELNKLNQRVMMPYDPKYKLGDGFNVADNTVRGSAFYQPAILAKPLISVEGQDGGIKILVVQDSQELASALAVDAQVWGKGWGASVKADFSFKQEYNMKSDEVLLIASHTIQLGKDFVDPSNFRLTANAQKILATNYQEFIDNYGTHFLAGVTKECDMDVFLRRKVQSSENKTDISASLKVSYKTLGFKGGASVSTSYSQDQKDFYSKTDIEIKYLGANSDAFIKGITVDELNDAILSFPEHCTGNIYAYVLWPYESCQSFLDVKDQIDILINQKKFEAIQNQTITQQQKDQQVQQQNDEYIKQQQQQQQKVDQQSDQQKFYTKGIDFIDELFTQAILQIKILRTGLEAETVTQQSVDKKNQDIWNMKLLEFQLNEKYQYYKNQIQDLSEKDTPDFNQQLQLIQQCRAEIQQFQQSQVDTIIKINCTDSNCVVCGVYNPGVCQQCIDSYILSINNLCLLNCPSSYFKVQDFSKSALAYQCTSCSSNCLECNVTAIACTKCDSSQGLNLQNSVCVAVCSSGTSPNNGICTTCSNSNVCATYKNSGVCDCNLCKTNFYMSNGQCIGQCPSKYYADTNTQSCQQCSSNCNQCSQNSTFCTSCNSDKIFQNNQCVSQCSNTYTNVNGQCQQCPNLVSQCQTQGTPNCNCQQCNSGYYLCSGTKCIANTDKILKPVQNFNGGSSIDYAIKGGQNNKFCSQQSTLECSKDIWDLWEKFKIEIVNGNIIGIKNEKNNTYCTDRQAEGRYMTCEATVLDQWQKFQYTVIDSNNGIFALKGGSQNHYCSDRGLVDCNVDVIGDWEKFQFLSMQYNC